MINFITKPFQRRKLSRLDAEHARLVERVAQARKHHERVSDIQHRLFALTAQILQLMGRV